MSDSRYIAGKRLLNARNSFDSNAIRDFLYGDEINDAEDSRLLSEGDWRSEKLTDDFFVAAGHIFIAGFQATYGRDLTPDQVKEFSDRFKYHLRKYEDFAHIMSDLMKKMVELPPRDHSDFEEADFGDLSFDAAARAEMVDRIAGAVYDAMTDGGWIGEFNRSALDELTSTMIAARDLDEEDWLQANIDFEEINDRVDEFKDDAMRDGDGL